MAPLSEILVKETAERGAGRAAPLPTLSVVVPNYNHARYLEAALRAHLAQSAPPCEILVVDDASSDESCAIVDRLAAEHPALRLIRLARNAGVNAAINRGLQEARGDCVCFSAADDLVAGDFTARSLDALARHPAAAFVFSDLALLRGGGGAAGRFPLFLSDRPRLLSPREIELLLRRDYFNFPSHTIVYRREALLDLGGFDEGLGWLADWFANCVLAFRRGACYVPEVLAFLRVSPDSYSARGFRQRGVQRDLIYRALDALRTDPYRDVARAFRDSGAVPEVRLRVLAWLLASPRHRDYLTLRLVARLVTRGPRARLMACLPDGLRRAARRLLGGPARRALGNA